METAAPMTVVLDAQPEGTVTVFLDAQPEGIVTVIDVTPGRDTDVSQTTLTFTTSLGADDSSTGWDVKRTVRVTAMADDDAVDERVTITHTATIDDEEVTLRDATVIVHVADPREQGVTVDVQTGTFHGVTETGSYTVVLDSEPTGRVTVDVGGVDVGGETGKISVSPSRLVFTRDNWFIEEMVRVYAVEDLDADADTVILTHTISGADYTNVAVPLVTMTVLDNDVRRIIGTPATLAVPVGSDRKFAITLDTQPKGDVKVLVSFERLPVPDGSVTLDESFVEFTSSNWNRPQDVEVTATSNALEDSWIVNLTVELGTSNGDVDYQDSNVRSTVNVSVTAALPSAVYVRTSDSKFDVQEDSTGKYNVRLSGDPVTDVTIYVRSPDLAVTVAPSSEELLFTANTTDSNDNVVEGSWKRWQEVMVTAVRDPNAVEEEVVLEHRWNDVDGPVVKTVTVDVEELDTEA